MKNVVVATFADDDLLFSVDINLNEFIKKVQKRCNDIYGCIKNLKIKEDWIGPGIFTNGVEVTHGNNTKHLGITLGVKVCWR